MNTKEFNKLLERRLKMTRDILSNKSQEYSRNADKLYNFKRAGELYRVSPIEALKGMKAKHDVSVIDMIEKAQNGIKPSQRLIDEKIGDSINYLILLEALLNEL